MNKNVGVRLLEIQKGQGTNLCVGLDPHVDKVLNAEFYRQFAEEQITYDFCTIILFAKRAGMFTIRDYEQIEDMNRLAEFLSGVVGYFKRVIDSAWKCRIRVYKPQSSFYEQFSPFGDFVQKLIVDYLHELARRDGCEVFIISDSKRGDIDSTQRPYLAKLLTGPSDDVVEGIVGQFDVDTMTITPWMGDDVFACGVASWFSQGKGAIAVTRSSNSSGTTYQDLRASANTQLILSDKQEPFRITAEQIGEITEIIKRQPTVAEVMMHQTTRFCRKHELIENGMGSVFSVMGSTVRDDGTFRKLRPDGVALVPGFGAQGGKWENAMDLLIQNRLGPEEDKGDFEGMGIAASSSRGHNFPWTKENGGEGNPTRLPHEMRRAIIVFKREEKAAYEKAGIYYPYNN